jgi:D-threo-aldose 1-dehydrogenase
LRLLEMDRLPLLLLHETDWAEWWPGSDHRNAPVMRFVREAKDRGLVQHVGISARKRSESTQLIRTGLFDAILYVHYYNVVWQDAGDDVIAAADDAGMTVLIGAPYRQGLLIENDGSSLASLRTRRRASVPPGAIDRIERVQAVSREIGMSMPQLGLRWLLSDPRIDSILVGPRSTTELAENLQWVDEGPLDAEVLNRLSKIREIELGVWS